MEAKERYVAMFDVLGFQALRHARGTAGLHQLYSRHILTQVQHAAVERSVVEKDKDGASVIVPDLSSQRVGVRVFSDTVLLWALEDGYTGFSAVVRSSQGILQSGFVGSRSPFRGAIGFGDLIVDNAIVVGSAIEDAYKGESSQAWAGCMFTPAAEEEAEKENHFGKFAVDMKAAAEAQEVEPQRDRARLLERLITVYDVPTQSNPRSGPIVYGCRRGRVLDWTISMYKGASMKSFLPTSSPHAALIAKNTSEFEAWARAVNRP